MLIFHNWLVAGALVMVPNVVAWGLICDSPDLVREQ
jgi:hypothetical protein